MPQPFLAVTLAAWSGGLSVMPHLGLYWKRHPTFTVREGRVGCRQEVVPGPFQKEEPRILLWGGHSSLLAPDT